MNCSVRADEDGFGADGAEGQHRGPLVLVERREVAAGFGIVLLVSQGGARVAASCGVVQRGLARSVAEVAGKVGVLRGSVNVSAPIEAEGRWSRSALSVG